jgi:hypothetical protein
VTKLTAHPDYVVRVHYVQMFPDLITATARPGSLVTRSDTVKTLTSAAGNSAHTVSVEHQPSVKTHWDPSHVPVNPGTLVIHGNPASMWMSAVKSMDQTGNAATLPSVPILLDHFHVDAHPDPLVIHSNPVHLNLHVITQTHVSVMRSA